MEKCPRCGSTEQDVGRLFVNQTNWNIRFRSNRASILSRKKQVQATACSSCGHVELRLMEYAGRRDPLFHQG